MTFDTIKYKLLNLNRYEDFALNLVRGSKVTVSGMKFVKTGFLKKEKEFTKCTLTSSSYDINYEVHLTQNYMMMEFSIPKYLYGHNTEHFPKNHNEVELENELKMFLLRFFLVEFKGEIQLEDIEIMRVDLCFNYKFKSLENKEMFKALMPKLFNSVFSETKSITYGENESVMYKTQDYSFKIYDKGLEFFKHDYKKLLKTKSRKEVDAIYYRSQFILRAELTFRKRKMSYDFFQNIKHTKQVSARFKLKFRTLKTTYNHSRGILIALCDRLNKYVMSDMTENELRISFMKFSRKNKHFSAYVNDDFYMNPIDIATKIKDSTDDVVFQKFTEIDINLILTKTALSQMAEYHEITSPKSMRLQLTNFERKYNILTRPEVIELDGQMMQLMVDKFRTIYEEINSFTSSKTTPLQVLNYIKEDLKDHKISVTGLKRYLKIRESEGKKKANKYFGSSTIGRYNNKINDINKMIAFKKPNSGYSLNNFDLPEKMNLI